MHLVPRATYFAACKNCNMHGKVYFSDGTVSEDLCLKEYTLCFIDSLLQEKTISEEEARLMKDTVRESKLLDAKMFDTLKGKTEDDWFNPGMRIMSLIMKSQHGKKPLVQ